MTRAKVVIEVVILFALLALVIVFVTATPNAQRTVAPSPTATATMTESPKPFPCVARGALPDPACTPGALNSVVTQSTIDSTICVAGWTGTIRPPSSYTTYLKVQQMALYGLTGTTADYEEDHFLPLELGGDPRDQRNLWPEPRAGTGSASEKDRLENHLHALVCNGTLPLDEAQTCILVDWTTCYRRYYP